jgi:hypothetical protein
MNSLINLGSPQAGPMARQYIIKKRYKKKKKNCNQNPVLTCCWYWLLGRKPCWPWFWFWCWFWYW